MRKLRNIRSDAQNERCTHIDTWILNVIKIFTERLTRGNMLKFPKNWIFRRKSVNF